MALATAQGNLTMVGLNTLAPQVFWNGAPVEGITDIKVDWDAEEYRVKLKVNNVDDGQYAELIEAGIIVRKGK